MSFEEYQRNLRGVNDGSDFAPEFLVCNTSGLLYFVTLTVWLYY